MRTLLLPARKGRGSSERLSMEILPLKMERRRTSGKSSALHVKSLEIMQVNFCIRRRVGTK
jgi:hypothetical protein